jgi:hypothetical protein
LLLLAADKKASDPKSRQNGIERLAKDQKARIVVRIGWGEKADPMVPIKQLDSPMKGSATLTEDQSKALTGGKMYFNVHTAKYPEGEIRGQLAPTK